VPRGSGSRGRSRWRADSTGTAGLASSCPPAAGREWKRSVCARTRPESRPDACFGRSPRLNTTKKLSLIEDFHGQAPGRRAGECRALVTTDGRCSDRGRSAGAAGRRRRCRSESSASPQFVTGKRGNTGAGRRQRGNYTTGTS